MSKRMPTLFSWIEAQEAQRIAEQAILARRESEWGEGARDGETPKRAVSLLTGLMRGFRPWLAQAAGALFGRRRRPA